MIIPEREFIGVSNNSRLTKVVHSAINNRLTDHELRAFQAWLRLIEREQTNKINNEKRRARLNGGWL